jgi:hypothetical protein
MPARTRPVSRKLQSTPSAMLRASLSRVKRSPVSSVVEPFLGRGDVGPAAQQLAGRAGVDAPGHGGQRRLDRELGEQCTGLAAREHGHSVHGARDLGLERRDA